MELQHDEIGDDQALLILYLAGELSADQHSQLEKRLNCDQPLRLELDELRAAQAMIWQEMLAADSSQPLSGSVPAAHRKLAGMVRQWAVDRLARNAPPVARGLSYRWWGVGLAAAAMLLIGWTLYWYAPHSPSGDALVDSSAGVEDVTDAGNRSDDLIAQGPLNQAERELDAVAYLRTLTQWDDR